MSVGWKRTGGSLAAASLVAGFALVASITSPTPRSPHVPPPTVTAFAAGVNVSTGNRSDGPGYAVDLGARAIRTNLTVTGPFPDTHTLQYLDAGMNVLVTVNYRNPENVRPDYGTLAQWTAAGFPYISRAAYQTDVTTALSMLWSRVQPGHVLAVQCENEIADASTANSLYWRGTETQYLDQLSALYDAVKAASPTAPVVMQGFTSTATDYLILAPTDPRYQYQNDRVSRLLSQGRYEWADFHLYGCADAITRKAQWILPHLPGTTHWISTECGGPNPSCAGAPLWQTDLTAFERAESTEVGLRLDACANGGALEALWFSLFNLNGEVDEFNHLGLLTQESVPRKKPAYTAYQLWTATNQ